MSQHTPENCERIEALLPSYVEGGLGSADDAAVRSHLEACESCRLSLVTFAMIEESLVSRRAEVPPVDRFLPQVAHAAAFAPAQRSRLVAAFRSMMSVPGVAIILVIWGAMFLLRFRTAVGQVFAWTSMERLSAFAQGIQGALVGVSGDNPYTLTAIYLALMLAVLASAGAITVRYVRS